MPKAAFSHFDNCFICFDISLGLISLLIFTDTVLYEGKTIWILCDHRTDGWGITLLQTYKKHSCHVFRTTLTERASYSFFDFSLTSQHWMVRASVLSCFYAMFASPKYFLQTLDGNIWQSARMDDTETRMSSPCIATLPGTPDELLCCSVTWTWPMFPRNIQ